MAASNRILITSKGSEYPYFSVLVGNTPDRFKMALAEAKKFMDKKNPKHKILTINSWNEWTEGSYIEPDTVHGLGYLEAIRKALGVKPQPA